jgi:hypothetical protein
MYTVDLSSNAGFGVLQARSSARQRAKRKWPHPIRPARAPFVRAVSNSAPLRRRVAGSRFHVRPTRLVECEAPATLYRGLWIGPRSRRLAPAARTSAPNPIYPTCATWWTGSAIRVTTAAPPASSSTRSWLVCTCSNRWGDRGRPLRHGWAPCAATRWRESARVRSPRCTPRSGRRPPGALHQRASTHVDGEDFIQAGYDAEFLHAPRKNGESEGALAGSACHADRHRQSHDLRLHQRACRLLRGLRRHDLRVRRAIVCVLPEVRSVRAVFGFHDAANAYRPKVAVQVQRRGDCTPSPRLSG